MFCCFINQVTFITIHGYLLVAISLALSINCCSFFLLNPSLYVGFVLQNMLSA